MPDILAQCAIPNQDMKDIVEMISTGYIAALISTRQSLIQFDRVSFANVEGMEDTPYMRHISQTYWVPFMRTTLRNFSAFTVAPFILVKCKVLFEGETTVEIVPFGLSPGEYTMTFEVDSRMEKIYTVNLINSKESIKTHVVESKLGSGFSPFSRILDSECGRLLPEWRRLRAMRDKIDILREKAHDPVSWLEFLPAAINDPLKTQEQIYDNLLNLKEGQHGRIETAVVLDVNKKDNTITLPRGLTRCNNQPVVDVELLSLNEQQYKFYELADMEFKLNMQHQRNIGTGHNHLSEHSLDEERTQTRIAMLAITRDLEHAIHFVFRMIYNTEPKVHIPHRSQLDRAIIKDLHSYGFLDSSTTKSLFGDLTGIDIE